MLMPHLYSSSLVSCSSSGEVLWRIPSLWSCWFTRPPAAAAVPTRTSTFVPLPSQPLSLRSCREEVDKTVITLGHANSQAPIQRLVQVKLTASMFPDPQGPVATSGLGKWKLCLWPQDSSCLAEKGHLTPTVGQRLLPPENTEALWGLVSVGPEA